MMSTIRSEWIKLVTVRANIVLLVLAAVLPLIAAFFTAAYQPIELLESASIGSAITSGLWVSALLCGALGAVVAAGEYSHNLARVTFAATPARVRVHVARVIVVAVVAGLVTCIAALITWFIAGLVASNRGVSTSITDTVGMFGAGGAISIVVAIVAASLLCALLTGFGVALGTLLRSPAGSVVFVLLWVLVAENTLRLALYLLRKPDWGDYIPYSAAWAAINSNSEKWVQSFPGGLIWFAGFVVGVFAIAVAIDSRRDA